jgi:hypothetical protein
MREILGKYWALWGRDGGAMGEIWRQHRHELLVRPEPDTGEIQGRYRGDTGQIQGRYREDTGEIHGRYRGDI